MSELFLHVPTPGDHYSAATGSATMTVIYEMSRRHAAQGGETRLVVGRGTRHDYPVGECTEAEFSRLPGRARKMLDVAQGRVGLPRKFITDTYRPAAALVPPAGATVFVHNEPGALSLFRASRPQGRLYLYAHNALFNTYTDAEVRRALDAADGVVCVSQFLADALTSRLGGQAGKIHAVNNGVDTERFHPCPEARQGGVPVILFVGRVVPEKGADLLLRAARKIHGGRRRFTVRIVGSRGFSAADPLSEYEAELRRLAAPLGDAVQFRPFRDRAAVLAEYQGADIFCAPSNWDEPCTLTVPEALACGLPTVAARRGGIPEVGGDAALYFDTEKVGELADRLAFLVDDAEARAGWGRKARARAEAISWPNQYRKLRDAIAR